MDSIIGRTLKGQTKSISVHEDFLVIIPRAMFHGFIGEKRIPYASITAVQFKSAGSWLAGFIQFSIKGGSEWRGQVNQDENALQFDRNANDDFLILRDFVETKLGNSSAPLPSSAADEIAKLSALKDQGVISDIEFDQLKAKLLR